MLDIPVEGFTHILLIKESGKTAPVSDLLQVSIAFSQCSETKKKKKKKKGGG